MVPVCRRVVLAVEQATELPVLEAFVAGALTVGARAGEATTGASSLGRVFDDLIDPLRLDVKLFVTGKSVRSTGVIHPIAMHYFAVGLYGAE
jgi:hypothetical protein